MRTLAWLAACLALCAHAEVFKWVDDKGRVQYGETPPVGTDATKMNVPPPSGNADAPAKAKEPASKPAANSEERTVRCEFEKKQQELLNGDAPVIYKDEKGEMVALDDAKKAAAKERVKDNVKRYCS
jgi:hypothetical protein